MNKIVEIKFGSHLYGTNTENSDLDFKGIYIPTSREIVLGNYRKTISTQRAKQPFERNTKDDVDVEIFSLDRYLGLLCQGQTVSLDMLFAPLNFITNGYRPPDFDYIFRNREKVLSRNADSFIGYARQQAAKYGQKGFRVHALRETLDFLSRHEPEAERIAVLGRETIEAWVAKTGNSNIAVVDKLNPDGQVLPYIEVCGKYVPFGSTFKHAKRGLQARFDAYGSRALQAEKNEGIDWKALSHAVRVNSEAIELLTTSFITFPRPDRELLLQVKLGQLPFAKVSELIEEGLQNLLAAQAKSTLRAEPDQKWVEDFIEDVYSDVVRKRTR